MGSFSSPVVAGIGSPVETAGAFEWERMDEGLGKVAAYLSLRDVVFFGQ
jgi:hypothetical protein